MEYIFKYLRRYFASSQINITWTRNISQIRVKRPDQKLYCYPYMNDAAVNVLNVHESEKDSTPQNALD